MRVQVRTARFPYHVNNVLLDVSGSHSDLGVIVDTSLKFNYIKRNAHLAGSIATNLLRSTLLRSQSFMLSIFISQVRPKMEYTSCLWHTEYIGDIKVLESVQRRWTRAIEGREEMSYAD